MFHLAKAVFRKSAVTLQTRKWWRVGQHEGQRITFLLALTMRAKGSLPIPACRSPVKSAQEVQQPLTCSVPRTCARAPDASVKEKVWLCIQTCQCHALKSTT
jgi:hypothetical protein